mgnify:CR=1 FL=1
MFRLNSPCISEIEYEGYTFKIDMAFDNILDVVDVINDTESNEQMKLYESLSYLLDGAYMRIIEFEDNDFLSGLLDAIRKELIEAENDKVSDPVINVDRLGNPLPVAKAKSSSDDGPKAEYSLTHDATYIYTSFIQAYNIDLHRSFGRIHWHEFNALLRDLPNTTAFGHIIEIRGTDTSKIKDKNERERIKKLQKQYRLPGQKPEV